MLMFDTIVPKPLLKSKVHLKFKALFMNSLLDQIGRMTYKFRFLQNYLIYDIFKALIKDFKFN